MSLVDEFLEKPNYGLDLKYSKGDPKIIEKVVRENTISAIENLTDIAAIGIGSGRLSEEVGENMITTTPLEYGEGIVAQVIGAAEVNRKVVPTATQKTNQLRK